MSHSRRAACCPILLALAVPSFAMAYREAVNSLLAGLDEGGASIPALFEEGFEQGGLGKWRADQGWTVVERPGGGKCALVTSSDDFEDLVLTEHVPVAPGHPVAVLWRTRLVWGSEPLYLRVDFFDAEGKTGEPYAQQGPSRATGEWTDNAIVISDWFPAYTREITIHFHQGPKSATSAMLDDVRVVDLGQVIGEGLAAKVRGQVAQLTDAAQRGSQSALGQWWCEASSEALDRDVVPAMEAAGRLDVASQGFWEAMQGPALHAQRYTDALAALGTRDLTTGKLLVYRTPATAPTMVLPDTADLPGAITREVTVSACPGEVEPVSLVLWSPEAQPKVLLTASALRGPGGTIPAAEVEIKWVKCWYQAGSAPHGVAQDRSRKVLVPELLLNDDALVEVDREGQHNRLRLSFPEGARYVSIDDPTDVAWGWRATVEEFPVCDSPQLLPLDLPGGENKQAWVRVRVPADARPGRYTGPITVYSDSRKLGQITLSVEVLPFTLEAPTAHYDPGRDFTYSLYYWGEMDPEGAGSIGYKYKSEAQFRAELRHMYAHGIVAPTMIWSPEVVYRNEALFERMLAIMKDTGMSGRPLHFGDSSMVGAPTDPAELEALAQNVAKTIATARRYGFTDVYFYGLDEATGERLAAQRQAWGVVHEAGGKVIVSGFRGQFEAVGDILDLFNWAGPLDATLPPLWHGQGHLIWNYGNPQTPVEDPAVYRRNYGLLLWKTDYDGACTYCYMDSSGTPWNDFDCDSYRDHNVAYPTVDGIVETPALEGLREGADDVKYACTLRHAIGRAKGSGPAVEAAKWLEALDPRTADLDEARREMVRWIRELGG